MVAGAAAVMQANDSSASPAVIVGRLARNAEGVEGTAGNGRLHLGHALTDDSTTPVTPAGAPGGSPIVGPYVAASNASFTGTVRNSVTTLPISGATVTVSCPGCNGASTITYGGGGTSTNATGQFTVAIQYAGGGPATATVTASATGFSSNSGSSTCSGAGNGTCSPSAITISLTPAVSSTISGNVLNDLNGDGLANDGGVGVAGATVALFRDVNSNGVFDSGTETQVGASVTTPASGAYSFASLATGVYFVNETNPAGFVYNHHDRGHRHGHHLARPDPRPDPGNDQHGRFYQLGQQLPRPATDRDDFGQRA